MFDGTRITLPLVSTLNERLFAVLAVLELVRFVNLSPDVPLVALVNCNLVLGDPVPIPTFVPAPVGNVFCENANPHEISIEKDKKFFIKVCLGLLLSNLRQTFLNFNFSLIQKIIFFPYFI
jgi:hypothetical protein